MDHEYTYGRTVVAENLRFPEGPAFDRDGNLYVVEMKGRQVSRIAPDGAVSVFANTGGGPNGSNFGPDGHLYVCNNGGFPGPDKEPGRIERIAPDGAIEVLIREVDGQPLNSPNDVGFDEHGNFYFTDPTWRTTRDSKPPGSIYFHDTEGTTHRLHTGFGFPNGIGVSPDGKTLIVCESLTYKLHAFDIHEPGVLGEPREFGDLGDGAHPDGFAFDADGNVLCCGFESGQIHVFPPTGGAKLTTLDFEDKRVTNVCFGGPDHKSLFVTESRLGRVVRVEWERPGMVLFPDRG